jgi:TatD DNase family protein
LSNSPQSSGEAAGKETFGVVLVDSHAHLELEPLCKNPAAIVNRASEAGVAAIVTVGIDLEDARHALRIADQFDTVFACVGVHPHNASEATGSYLNAMAKLANHLKVRGYGEIGLDFFRNRSPHDCQRSVFADQLTIAKDLGKPVVIHLRDAYEEGLAMLEKAAPFPAGGVIHCFSGNMNDANRALELGFFISIPGTVTYKKNQALRDIVKCLPDDRILLETDCPFLSPEPLRGKDNEPSYIVHTARKVAEVKSQSLEHIASVTSANAARVFGLPL